MDTSATNLAGLVGTFTACFLLLVLPRRYAVLPIFVAAAYMTLGQYIVVGPLHFYMIRIIILAGLFRMLARRESSLMPFTNIDRALVHWVVVMFLVYVIREQSQAAFVNRLGFAFNTLGLYFLFRYFIRDYSDIIRICKMLAVIAVPLAAAMLMEKITGRNVFSFFGGVDDISPVRYGKIRAQGPFMHPILAGTFGITTLFILLGLYFQGRHTRKLAIFGIIAGSIIGIASASSGPFLALIFGLLGLVMWHFKNNMRLIRWSIVISILMLHLTMQAPVWYLFARVSELTGGTGWHRSELINSFITHFSEWWLLGTSYTAHWGLGSLPTDPNMADITNYYIRSGVDGGLASFILFILILIFCFKAIGTALTTAEPKHRSARLLLWSLGVALFAHMVSFLSVSYFDQISVFWYMLLAMVSFVAELNNNPTPNGGIDKRTG